MLAEDLVFFAVVALVLGAVFDLFVLLADFLTMLVLRVGDFVGVVFHCPSFCAWAFFLQIEQVVALIAVACIACDGARPAFGDEHLTQAFITCIGFDVQTMLIFIHHLNVQQLVFYRFG